MKRKFLDITLKEYTSFEKIKSKVESAFNLLLQCKNQDGRLIAKGTFEDSYIILLIDRYDDLDESLCDEDYVLSIEIEPENNLDYREIENIVMSKLKFSNIKWEYGIWSKDSLDEKINKIFPSE